MLEDRESIKFVSGTVLFRPPFGVPFSDDRITFPPSVQYLTLGRQSSRIDFSKLKSCLLKGTAFFDDARASIHVQKCPLE